MSLPPNDARALAQRILGGARLSDVRVKIRAATSGHHRFAQDRPTTAGDVDELDVWVTAVTPDGRCATVQGNRRDDASLAALVRKAETLAEFSPIDPEHMPPIGATEPHESTVTDREVLRMQPKDRVTLVEECIQAGRAANVVTAGFIEHCDEAEVFADRAGQSAYQRYSSIKLGCSCRTPDGMGSSSRSYASHAKAGLKAGALATEAATSAVKSQSPQRIEPGPRTVILMPNAVAELLAFFVGALAHRDAVEGRSPFSTPDGKTRLGEVLFNPLVNLWSDPADKQHPAKQFAEDGIVQPRTEWVLDGKLNALRADRYWAHKVGVPVVPWPSSFHMKGEDKSLETLIAGVKDGVLVTRFWYNRIVEPASILATGLTRDGTFAIADGAIRGPVTNLRYNESPLTLLERVVALGRPERAASVSSSVWVVPPIVVEGFNFASTSDAI